MSEQSDRWGDDFGDEYTRRNPNSPDDMEALYRERFGIERTAMNEAFLGGLERSARILEIGCNVGTQLSLLSRMGFENLYGIEINSGAIERSHGVNKGLPIWVLRANARDVPFKDGWFDLVYTSGVLIHISPDDIAGVMREMDRCTCRYVWGFEYFTADGYVEIPYHGQRNMLWKTDFARLFERTFPDLRLARDERYPYAENPALVDQMYLLEKRG